MVPKGWKVKKLSDVSTKPISYGIVQTGEQVEGGTPCVRVIDLTKSVIEVSNMITTSSKINESYSRTILENEEIMVALRSEIGLARIVTPNLAGANLTRGIARISPNKAIAQPDFLLWAIRSEQFKRDIMKRSGGSALQEIAIGELRKVRTLLPPLPEQKKIAKILSTWDEAIVTTEQLLANSQQQKKALMQQLLTGKKRFPGFKGEWKEVRIGSLLKEVKRPVKWDDDADYKLLSVRRRSEGLFLREILSGHQIKTKNMSEAHAGDFLISKMQIVHGATGLVTKEFDRHHISGSYISLVPKDPQKLNIEFFAWFNKQCLMYHKAYLCSYGVHIEKMTFNFKLFLKESIRIPGTVEEQSRIVEALNTADAEIATLQQKLDRLKEEKKALMQQLLTGKRRVKVDKEAVA